jgi:hypothetical protein
MALWAHGGTRAARRLGRQGFVALSPYRRFLRRGPAGPVILTKSGALVCILRLHPSDLESESSERRARVCEALAQAFSALGDGWGTWINVISRARRQYLARGALWHPTMVTVDEAQRRRFEDESANYKRECFISLVYQPPAPHKQRLFDLAMGAAEMVSRSQARVLRRAVRDKRNILIIGGTGSGKTTIANTLLGEIDRGERVVILEELSELRRESGRHTVYLQTTAQHDLTSLVRTTMRLKPDRIIIGELRGGEALALLKAWVTGHPGRLRPSMPAPAPRHCCGSTASCRKRACPRSPGSSARPFIFSRSSR